MYAVIKTGGKQYRVQEGDTLRVEKLAGSAGDKIEFAEVLMLGGTESPKIGMPVVSGAKVAGDIVEQGRGRKVFSFRKKKEGWKRIRGHRQAFTAVKITKISG
ncbi:50S ribosomal protein L21 [Vulgatibacter incomptus]|uniref:Large ribosomal subunit protein bL21 n=1 Tax=Vulgatibacter incomptus TaxID=1391653 RepID=A0A0K1PII5_9BACT|nr:50S ribosomal protein L21 [Vulgatibacter incomptus]AKU89618.1 LSU ribosomal protein L21p [Vulgatibacter incomptus]AKU93322.1 LSU ribosomal protein L21p [Vulgatibacter incomptus]